MSWAGTARGPRSCSTSTSISISTSSSINISREEPANISNPIHWAPSLTPFSRRPVPSDSLIRFLLPPLLPHHHRIITLTTTRLTHLVTEVKSTIELSKTEVTGMMGDEEEEEEETRREPLNTMNSLMNQCLLTIEPALPGSILMWAVELRAEIEGKAGLLLALRRKVPLEEEEVLEVVVEFISLPTCSRKLVQQEQELPVEVQEGAMEHRRPTLPESPRAVGR
ncbi:hypothetical protein TYRP_019830 [Tyrophagus putrescentiae]|nr:hypothetical protein TYRP_019830 [Tyrophagus putrescentiae]